MSGARRLANTTITKARTASPQKPATVLNVPDVLSLDPVLKRKTEKCPVSSRSAVQGIRQHLAATRRAYAERPPSFPAGQSATTRKQRLLELSAARQRTASRSIARLSSAQARRQHPSHASYGHPVRFEGIVRLHVIGSNWPGAASVKRGSVAPGAAPSPPPSRHRPLA